MNSSPLHVRVSKYRWVWQIYTDMQSLICNLSAKSNYSSKMTAVTSPSTFVLAIMSPSLPDATSRLMMTTRLSDCRPTATRSPALLTENWRGMRPPAGNFCSSVRAPVCGLILKLLSESEGICAPSPLVSGLLMLKAESFREETVRNLPLGCVRAC